MKSHIVSPVGWGDDLLSQFQSVAFKNELATFAHAPEWQHMLCDVATVLDKCSHYAMQCYPNSDDSALLLFISAQSQYLASVRSVAAGHCLAAYPTGRAAVESALYGCYLANNTGASERWHNKPPNSEGLKVWNNEFKFSSLTRNLGDKNPALAKWAKYLHQTAIDFGAHPNQHGLYSSMEYEQSDGGASSVKMVHLHPWNEFSTSTANFTA
jgi:hypothetical protein